MDEFESFYGRDRQIDQLLGRLRERRFVAVVGTSGSGKSSLVRAGLIHRLEVGHLTTAGSRWHVALMRPGSKPIPALAAALDQALGPLPDRANDLRLSTQRLLHSTRTGRGPQDNLLVVVDQFEEVFRYQSEELISRREAAHFIDLLLAAEQDLSPDYRVYIVLTMRTDFLGDCAQFEGLPEALNSSQYLVPRLTRDETREAIIGPAALADVEVDPNLLQTMLVESFEGRDTLPLLQHVLTRLWDLSGPADGGSWRLQLAAYERLGGITRALNDHADETLAQLSQPRQLLAKRIFQELTDVGQGRDQRRPMRLSELSKRTGGKVAEVEAVVMHFLEQSFVSSPDRGREADWEADISHESLIRQWNTLREWAKDEATDCDDYLYFAKRVVRGGELLTGEDLALALRWRERGRTADWAKRYGGDFQATEDFIVRSNAAAQARLEVEKERLQQADANRKSELRRARRFQLIFAGMALVLLVLFFWAFQTKRQADRASHESRARELAAFASESLSSDPERAIFLSMQAVEATMRFGQAPLAAAEDALHHSLITSSLRLTLFSHSGGVFSVAYSPDGKWLATASGDGTAKVWDAESGKELLTLSSHTGGVFSVAYSPDGKRLATASGDGTAKVWDAASGKELLTLRGHTDRVISVAYSPDGKRLATASADKTAKVWDAASGKELLTLRGHSGRVVSVAYSPDGKRLATASPDGTAKVWDTVSGKELLTLRGHLGSVSSVAFSPGGTRLATASSDETAKVWDTVSGKELLTLRGHSDMVFEVAYSPDGTRLATASGDKTAKVWDAASGQELFTLRGHSGSVNCVVYNPDGKRLATASTDRTAKVWDTASGKELLTLRGHLGSVYKVAYSPDGTRLATASGDGTAKVWDAARGQELLTLRGHSDPVISVAYSPDGKRLATASGDGTAKVWDAASGQELFTLRGHSGSVNSVVYSPDGKRLATASDDKTAKVWDAASGQELFTLKGHSNSVISVVYSPDGKRLATASFDKTAKVWDAASSQELLTLKSHSDSVTSVAYSPDGKQLATTSFDGTAKVWDAASGNELLALRGHSDSVYEVAYSPDGKRLATASGDGTAKVWDAVSGEELLTLRGHTDRVISVAYSPDGKRLATASADKTVQVYAMSINDLLHLARSRVTRDLTPDECRKYFDSPTCPPLP